MTGSRRRSMILGRDPARGQLAGIAAAAVFVACVALAVALAAADSTARWRGALARALTIEIAPVRSAPEQNALGPLPKTMTRTSASWLARSNASTKSVQVSGKSPLRLSGRFRRIQARGPSCV